MKQILVLGAGELGSAIVEAVLTHPSYRSDAVALSVLVRPESLSPSATADKQAQIADLRSQNVHVLSGNLDTASQNELAAIFRPHSTIIHAGAMTQSSGTQLKITEAALAAEVDEYVPWQWGVDYDVIGPEAGHGLFSEQCQVRTVLRAQEKMKWFIVSCGIFMSFLFEPFWGVVERDLQGKVKVIRALGGWDHLLTATTAEDIARCCAELILVDTKKRNMAVYIAGETARYDKFAEMVEEVVGRKVERQIWTTKELKDKSEADFENKLLKYRVVFSEDRGLAWPEAGTYNKERGITMEGYLAWMARNLE